MDSLTKMEVVLCTKHQKPCLLKTGVNAGANYGRNFYICGSKADRCSFVQESSHAGHAKCRVHTGEMVELQFIQQTQNKSEKRQYFRCNKGRAEKANFCGYTVLKQEQVRKWSPLQDIDKNRMPSTNTTQAIKKTPPMPTDLKTSSLEPKFVAESNKSKLSGQSRNVLHTSSTSGDVRPKVLQTKPSSFADLSRGQNKEELSESFSKMGLKDRKHQLQRQRDLDANVSEYRDSIVEISSDSDSDGENIEEYDTASEDEVKPGSAESDGDDDCYIDAVDRTEDTKQQSPHDDTSKEVSKPTVDVVVKKPSPTADQSKPKILIKTQDGKTFVAPKEALKTFTTSSGVQVITVPRPATAPSQAKQGSGYVPTNTYKNLQKDKARKVELTRLLEEKQNISKKVNIKALPDNGSKIMFQIENLKLEIGNLEEQITRGEGIVAKERELQASNPPKVTQSQVSLITGQVRTVSGQVLPASSYKQTKITDHATSQPLPAHVYQQLYAANPQLHSLYGGRMTAARQREVGAVTAEAIERLHKQLETCPCEDTLYEDPSGVKVPLMPHQKHALAWLDWREKQHPPGGILADDMGLGKTLTMISLVAMKKERSKGSGSEKHSEWLKKLNDQVIKSKATLVVCPASLVHQWGKEVEKRCRRGLLDVVIYHGPNREKDIHRLAAADLVLTTYNIISKEVGVPEGMKKDKIAQEMPAKDQETTEGQPPLLKVAWERIILDEAHNIKNHKSLTAMSVSRLRAMYRWALTGTPIQNDLLDMYSLLRFLRCSPFDEYKVWKRQVDNKSSKGTQRLNTLVKSLLLRRTKDQKVGKEKRALVELPPKHVYSHDIQLSPQEKLVYDHIFQQSKSTMQNYLMKQEAKQSQRQGSGGDSKTNPWAKDNPAPSQISCFIPASQITATQFAGSRASEDKKTSGTQILLLLLRLRQCCSHLSLMKEALDVDELQTDGLDLDLVEQMQQMALKETDSVSEPSVKKTSDLFELDSRSTKIKAVVEGIKDVKKNSPPGRPMKSVIVSQWTKMLDIVEYHLKKLGVRCCTIRGNVPPKTRAELVDTFNTNADGPEVMLVSLRAGGVGLNLIGGNHLFLIDMHWNPALEQQACDRIYRVGQVNDVHIHRFICKDTVEEKILQLQKKKLSLADNVLSGAGSSANKLTLADLKMLFGLDQQNPITQFDKVGFQASSHKY